MNIKKRYISTFVLLFLITIFSYLYQMVISRQYLMYSEAICISFLIIIVFLAVVLLGFRKDKSNYLQKNILMLVIISLILFFVITYGIGFFVGFLKNSYSLKVGNIINNVFFPIGFVIGIELLRYILIKANSDNKVLMVISTIILIVLELCVYTRMSNFSSIANIFKYGSATVIPILLKNCIFSYFTYYVGYKPGLIYRLVMEVYLFVIPIIPDLGEYINTMINICIPILIYIYASRVITEHYKGIEYDFSKNFFKWTDVPIVLFIIFFFCLITGCFPFYIKTIASESMSPKINKGDAVIIIKVDKEKDLKIGDVIAYENGSKVIIHRFVDLEQKDDKLYYRTKGDMNKTRDNVDTEFSEIEGKVIIRIPYLGYPSLIFQEMLGKR